MPKELKAPTAAGWGSEGYFRERTIINCPRLSKLSVYLLLVHSMDKIIYSKNLFGMQTLSLPIGLFLFKGLHCQPPLPHFNSGFLEATWNVWVESNILNLTVASSLDPVVRLKSLHRTPLRKALSLCQETLLLVTEAAGFSSHLVNFDCRPQAEWPFCRRAASLHLCLQTHLTLCLPCGPLLKVSRNSQTIHVVNVLKLFLLETQALYVPDLLPSYWRQLICQISCHITRITCFPACCVTFLLSATPLLRQCCII